MLKKILVITDNIRDQINGVVTTFKSIEEHALLDGYSILYLDPREFIHFNCPGYPEVKLSIPWKIGKKIEEISPDYIHIATEGPVGMCARLYLDKRGYRYNTSYHTKFPEFLNQIYKIPKSLTYFYMRWFHKHSGVVLTTTDAMVRDLKENQFTNVVSWTRGVDRKALHSSLKPEKTEKPTILSVGRLSKEKNLDVLINYQIEYNLIIVGDGPYRRELEKKLPHAYFTGYKVGSELADYYAKADVFVFTSFTDTFGLVMIEAMSMGTPVAAYPVRGPIDVVEEGLTGYMDQHLGKAITRALTLDRELVKKHSMKWSWENCWNIFKENLKPIQN